MQKKFLALSAVALLSAGFLSGCVNRDQADVKLANACRAGIDALVDGKGTISEVKDTKFSSSTLGKNMRQVQLVTVVKDDWLETDTIYECIFNETFGPFGLTYSANLHNISTGDEVYGFVDGTLVGTIADFTRLTEAMAPHL